MMQYDFLICAVVIKQIKTKKIFKAFYLKK